MIAGVMICVGLGGFILGLGIAAKEVGRPLMFSSWLLVVGTALIAAGAVLIGQL